MSAAGPSNITTSDKPTGSGDAPPPKQRRKPGRVPVSCAECRRLKLKCDRKVPCETCTKRGCAAICPNGSLATGRSNNKYVLANTEQLHMQIERMTRRIRELEHGLGAVTLVFATPSPPKDGSSTTSTEDTIDSFGTLSIGTKGDSRFYGASARGEARIYSAGCQDSGPSYFEHTRLSERILSYPFPEASPELITPEVRRIVYSHLPPFEDARGACELYLNHSSYILLFSEGNYIVESHDFFVLSRVALTLDSPVATTTVTAVQTLVLMAEYLGLSDLHMIPTGCARAWLYVGMAMKFAHSIGLHLGGARFNLGKSEIERRNRVFWHLFTADVWASFTFGRPPSTSLSFVDCDLPEETESQMDTDGERTMSYQRWNDEFTKLLSQVMATAFTARPPPYAAILDLDRKLRDFYVPPYLRAQWTTGGSEETTGSLLCIKRWIVLSNKEWALLNIHRAYFAQALRENPLDPLKHKYGLSVMALYRSAYRLVEGCTQTYQAKPPGFLFFRTNFASSKVLSAAIVMCLLVCSAPKSNLAAPALDVLNKAVAILESGVESGSAHLSENMTAVRSLHREAHEAVEKVQSAGDAQPLNTLRADELDRLCGMTRRVQAAPPVLVVPEQLAGDYSALSGLVAPAPLASTTSEGYAPPDPRLVQHTEAFGAGAWEPGAAAAFAGEEAFAVGPLHQAPRMEYILDASWNDFATQLGF
ncbi:fungal-specific transcription factor domain-containing protein [Gloeopeniophorella convolvens]|nr:fungal-specific transcription factor domain-containing protein [Gloeopeniophorella convolvens]